MRILIVGATSQIAKECARLWVGQSTNSQDAEISLILVGRNSSALESVAAELRVRNGKAKIEIHALDLTSVKQIEALEPDLANQGTLDIALIAQGELTDQELAQSSVSALSDSIALNATSVVLFAEIAARIMEAQGFGKIAVIGSVAGDRARRTNYSYGASKSFLATYVKGMQHRFAATNIKPIIIKPGPTATPMTVGLSSSGKLADSKAVASQIVSDIDSGKLTIYTPKIWSLIMFVVRNIPSAIFNKMNF